MAVGNLVSRVRRALSSPWRVGAPFLLLVGLFVACSSSPNECDYGACDGGALDGQVPFDGTLPETSILDAKPDADPIPTDCTTPTDPAKNPEKCLVDSYGAFVSPLGNDGDAGTKAKPFKTIAKALGTTRTRIVVCEGEYAGSLEVARGVEIYSGVTCDFSKAGGKAKIVASKPAYGVKVAKVSDAVILADLEVVGMNAVAPSESSVGVFVSESANVKIARSKIEAGDGADAPPKKDGAFVMPASAPNGGDAAGNVGGAAVTTGTCPGGGTSGGGKGGDIGFQGDDASPRPPGGAKGAFALCNAGGGGNDGDPGTPGTSRLGAATNGALSTTGFASTSGEDGANGTPGGGGGGGNGTMGAGGAGGAGGCGGQGGTGGRSGGSSIALAVFSSVVSLEAVDLNAKNAKAGGAGGSGQMGQSGGAGGTRAGMACNGGNGAKGGNGGGGGGGAGGIAVGIAWAGGKEPTRDASTKITRPTGAAPLGGEGGAGATNKGVDGVHADVFEVK